MSDEGIFALAEFARRVQDIFTLNEFARRNRIGLSTTYAEIRAGRLAACKIGRRTVITADDERAWRERLPKMQRTSSGQV